MKGCGDGDMGGDWSNHEKQQLGAGRMAWWLEHLAHKCDNWSSDSQKSFSMLGLCGGLPGISALEDQGAGDSQKNKMANRTLGLMESLSLSEEDGRVIGQDIWYQPWVSTCRYTHMHAYTCVCSQTSTHT